MLNGRRVVLEGLTVNHYQRYAGRSEGLSRLPAVEMLERFSRCLTDFQTLGAVAVVMPDCCQMLEAVTVVMYGWSNFFT